MFSHNAATERRDYSIHRPGAVTSVGLSNGESVVATFFLIRYQSVVASRREINFARQLFRISFFISPLEQQFADALPERFRSEIPLDSPAVTNRNTACLFRDY